MQDPQSRESHALRPGTGLGPPVIPEHTGAAAKASAALQNEYLARSLQNKWLSASSSDDGNDRESGIGIVVSDPDSDVEIAEISSIQQSISRVDFISQLPTELAIHILACLDALDFSIRRRIRVPSRWAPSSAQPGSPKVPPLSSPIVDV